MGVAANVTLLPDRRERLAVGEPRGGRSLLLADLLAKLGVIREQLRSLGNTVLEGACVREAAAVALLGLCAGTPVGAGLSVLSGKRV